MSGDSWDDLWRAFDTLRASVRKSRAQNVNAKNLREEARSLVQRYFRAARPQLVDVGLEPTQLTGMDTEMQDLLRLANGLNSKRSYLSTLDGIRRLKSDVDVLREMGLGSMSTSQNHVGIGVERTILETLRQLVPSAAVSYEQALLDLHGPARYSYRGTAVEIRESVRELLDHLAPDPTVVRTAGFTFEKGQNRPTMKQKARFILKSRGKRLNAMSSPEDAVDRIEEATASVTRSTYVRGSVATHVPTSARNVRELKLYADAVLAELLEVL